MMKLEPTAQEIKDQCIYAGWGLTDEEYRLISEDILGRLPNYTETGLFSVMWSEHCSYKNSKPVLRKFPSDGPQVLQGPGEGADKQWFSKQKAIITHQQLSHMKVPQQELAELLGISSVWGLAQLLF